MKIVKLVSAVSLNCICFDIIAWVGYVFAVVIRHDWIMNWCKKWCLIENVEKSDFNENKSEAK